MTYLQDTFRIILIGIGATAVMDIWLILLRRVGVPTLHFAFVGRWVGHLIRGTVRHRAISQAQPIPGELAWGWLAHYATGIAFAALLWATQGPEWAHSPTLLPALATGAITVLVPFCIIQPAMGAGFASSNTQAPLKNCLRSLANHTVFGMGLYLAAVFVSMVAPAA